MLFNFRPISGFKRWWNHCRAGFFWSYKWCLCRSLEINAHSFTQYAQRLIRILIIYTKTSFLLQDRTHTPCIVLVTHLKILTNKRMESPLRASVGESELERWTKRLHTAPNGVRFHHDDKANGSAMSVSCTHGLFNVHSLSHKLTRFSSLCFGMKSVTCSVSMLL